MAHYLFNFSDGDRGQATGLLRAKMWGVGRNERHRDALAPGDLALIYLSAPEAEFIGRAELATAVHEWTPSEAAAYPGDSAKRGAAGACGRVGSRRAYGYGRAADRSDRIEPARPGERSGRFPNGRRSDYR
jgi:hypothetical protein